MKRWNATLGSWVHEGVEVDALPRRRPDEARRTRKRPRSECSICFAIPAGRPAVCRPCRHLFCGPCAVEWLNRAPTCPLCRCRVSCLTENSSGRMLWSAPAPREAINAGGVPAAAAPAPGASGARAPDRWACLRSARAIRAPPRRRWHRSGDGPVPRQRSPPADPVAWRCSVYRRQHWAVPPPAGSGSWEPSRGPASPTALSSLSRGRVPARLAEWAVREVCALTGASSDAVLDGAVRQILLDRPCAALHAQPRLEDAVLRRGLPRWWDVVARKQQHCPGRRACLDRWRDAFAAWLPEQHVGHFLHELSCFALSAFSVPTYDCTVVYRCGPSHPRGDS